MFRKDAPRPAVAAADPTFVTDWTALSRTERQRLGRVVRQGRGFEADDREIGVRYARFQASRPWMRYFWLWFVPGAFVALAVASRVHPIAVGITLALAAQAILKWRNLRRMARTSPAE
jgi:hypothetical protein